MLGRKSVADRADDTDRRKKARRHRNSWSEPPSASSATALLRLDRVVGDRTNNHDTHSLESAEPCLIALLALPNKDCFGSLQIFADNRPQVVGPLGGITARSVMIASLSALGHAQLRVRFGNRSRARIVTAFCAMLDVEPHHRAESRRYRPPHALDASSRSRSPAPAPRNKARLRARAAPPASRSY